MWAAQPEFASVKGALGAELSTQTARNITPLVKRILMDARNGNVPQREFALQRELAIQQFSATFLLQLQPAAVNPQAVMYPQRFK